MIALAHREYESWFVAACRSLTVTRHVREGSAPPVDLGLLRNAKGWLGARMEAGYDPIRHQLLFTRSFDLGEARTSPSFDRLCRRLQDLVAGTYRGLRNG